MLPLPAVIVEWLVPPPESACESATVLPGTGLPPTSIRVTVMVAVVLSSAGTAAGSPATVDSAALAVPTAMVTLPDVPVLPPADVAVNVPAPIVPV